MHDAKEQTLPTAVTHSHWLDVLLLTLILAAFFGWGLGERALWHPDEGRYSEIPREMVETGDYVTPRLNGVKYFEKPALFYWLQAGAIRLFGLNEWALRLWPALFGLVGCLVVYGAGRALYGRRAGLLAAAVLATSPLYYLLARIVTLDMAVAAFLSAALLCFLLGVRARIGRARRLCLYAFYALCALATLTKGLMGLVLPAMVIGAWILLLNEWRLLRSIYLPSGLLLFLAIAAPWHVLVARANPEFAQFYFIHEHLERYLTTVHMRYQPWWFFIPVFALGMLPWAAFLFQAVRSACPGSWRARHERREELFLMLWAGLVFAFFSASGSKLIPYILPVLPPLALLAGRYLAAAGEKSSAAGLRLGFWLCLVLVTTLGLLVAYALTQSPQAAADFARLGARLYVLAAVLILCLAVLFLLGRRRRAPGLFVVLALSTAALVGVFDGGLGVLDAKFSVREHALAIRPRLAPADEVMTFRAYYQDLPVYLERRITVVGWKGELEFGAGREDVRGWMIDEAELRRRWQSAHTVYMITDRDNLEDLRALDLGYRVLNENDYTVLLTNREPAP